MQIDVIKQEMLEITGAPRQAMDDFFTKLTPIRPESKKGKIRREVANLVMEAHKTGRIEALIARAADFYGPNVPHSVLIESIAKNLQKGKPSDVLMSKDQLHSYTFTPDAGRAKFYTNQLSDRSLNLRESATTVR